MWRTAGYFGVFIYVFKLITVEFGLGYDVNIEQYVYSNFDTNIVSTCNLDFSTTQRQRNPLRLPSKFHSEYLSRGYWLV
jgi:hypothetical protein